MNRARLAGFLLAAALALWAPSTAPAAEDVESPHYMRQADGEADTAKCAACHNDDMSLVRSQLETCTLCHGETPHAGAAQHLRADAATVARVTAGKNTGADALPLTDDDRMYCGTCHVFHDPILSQEAILPKIWLPGTTGVAQAVRESLSARWARDTNAREANAREANEKAASSTPKGSESEPGAHFSTQGTARLRLAVADGSLCRHCHGYGK